MSESVCKLKNQKATGSDDIPAEYWKAVITDTDNLDWLVALCNKCWLAKAVPEEWQLSEIKCLYKKGDIESCDNYRPISLISVTYKLLATLLLKGLQEAGAEDRLTESQYGFVSSFVLQLLFVQIVTSNRL